MGEPNDGIRRIQLRLNKELQKHRGAYRHLTRLGAYSPLPVPFRGSPAEEWFLKTVVLDLVWLGVVLHAQDLQLTGDLKMNSKFGEAIGHAFVPELLTHEGRPPSIRLALGNLLHWEGMGRFDVYYHCHPNHTQLDAEDQLTQRENFVRARKRKKRQLEAGGGQKFYPIMSSSQLAELVYAQKRRKSQYGGGSTPAESQPKSTGDEGPVIQSNTET